MKKLFFSLLAVAAMASCSKSELADRPDNTPVEIAVSGVNVKAASRAPFQGAIASDNTLLAKVLVSKTTKSYTTIWNTADDQMLFADDNTTQVGFQTTPAYFPTDGSDVYLIGFYPSTGWNNISNSAASNNFDYIIDGKSDVMYAKEKKTNKAEAQAGTYPTLEFNHLLTQLVIKVQAENEAAAAATTAGGWGKVTDIAILKANKKDIPPVLRVNVTNDAVTFRSDEITDEALASLPCYIVDESGEFTDNVFVPIEMAYPTDATAATFEAPAVAYSLARPVTTANVVKDHYTLLVKTESEPDGREIPVTLKTNDATPVAFESPTTGYAFDITLTFKATDIEAKATVTAWKQGGNTSIDIE